MSHVLGRFLFFYLCVCVCFASPHLCFSGAVFLRMRSFVKRVGFDFPE